MTRKEIYDMFEKCYDCYKHRLSEHNLDDFGLNTYEKMRCKIVRFIVPYNPINVSFSISSDPSLHFFIRITDIISLAVETFLDKEDGNRTYTHLMVNGKHVMSFEGDWDTHESLIKKQLDFNVN